MQDENEVKTNNPRYNALVISEPTHLKITLICSRCLPFHSIAYYIIFDG
jgi:hypothetical protein